MFLSFEYYLFLAAVLIIYYLCTARYKPLVLLIASYSAYLYVEPYLFYVLIIETLVCYTAAYVWDGKSDKAFRRHAIAYGLFLLFSLLVFFKINAFFVPEGHDVTGGYYNILRPLGISFFTFQAAAYLFDVRRGKYSAEKNILNMAVYIAFFPQLVCGPIERAKRLMPQLLSPRLDHYRNFSKGMFYIAWGLMYKFLIADNLGLLVDSSLYSGSEGYVGLILVSGVVLFFFELYADFQAYTLIAIGSASLFGVNLSENFKRPICSKSLSEFWKRWHITLLHWLRDYIYAPVARMKIFSTNVMKLSATFFVFMFFGLWHGISWNFVVFGFVIFVLSYYDNTVLSAKNKSLLTYGLQKKVLLYLGLASMFLLAAKDLGHAGLIIENIFRSGADWSGLVEQLGTFQLLIIIAVLLMLIGLDVIQERHGKSLYEYTREKSTAWKITVYLFFLSATLMFGEFGQKGFAYFGF